MLEPRTAWLILLIAGVAMLWPVGAWACPVSEQLAAPEAPASEEIAALRQQLSELGAEACGQALLDASRAQPRGWTSDLLAPVFADWDDAAWLPALYTGFGHAMLRPFGRAEELARGSALAIEHFVGERDPLGPVLSGEAGADWPQLARDRYATEWADYLASTGMVVPPADARWEAAASAALAACIAADEDAPGDPFDPGGLRQDLAARLSLGTRCASASVLDAWSVASSPRWAALVDDLVDSYPNPSDFSDLALLVERRSRESGRAAPPSPLPDATWQTPDAGAGGLRATVCWTLVLVLLCVFGGILLRARIRGLEGRKALFPALAVAVGLGGLGILEGALSVLGVDPGDEHRALPLAQFRDLGVQGDAQLLADESGRAFETPRPEGVVRLAVVGASSVAGMNLTLEDSFPIQLEQRLRVDFPCLEVVNLGRPGAGSPLVHSLAVAAADQFGAEAVVIYTGHNEVGEGRQLQDALPAASSTAWRAAATRLHLVGLLSSLLSGGEGTAEEVEEYPQPDGGLSYELHDPGFERAVVARFERELGDAARALRRRGLPVLLVVPSFNHHGLRIRRLSSGSGAELAAELELRAFEHLEAGDMEASLAAALELREVLPGAGSPWLLASLALDGAGRLPEAEEAAWEAARRNQLGSALTPGLAAAILRVAEQQDLPVADVHARLHREAGGQLPGYDLHWDYVHLNPRGSAAAAAELEASLRSAGVVDAWQGRCRP